MSISESFSNEEDISYNSQDLEKMDFKLEQNDRQIRIDQEYKYAKSDLYLSSLGCSIGEKDLQSFLDKRFENFNSSLIQITLKGLEQSLKNGVK